MNESSPRSDSISIIYNGYDCSSAVKNSLVPLQQLTCILLMQTSTNTHHLDLFTQVLTITKQFPASGPFHKRPITHSPKVHTYHTRISIFFCSQFSSLVNFQGSIRETCFDAYCPLTHILFSSKPGNLHSTLT